MYCYLSEVVKEVIALFMKTCARCNEWKARSLSVLIERYYKLINPHTKIVPATDKCVRIFFFILPLQLTNLTSFPCYLLLSQPVFCSFSILLAHNSSENSNWDMLPRCEFIIFTTRYKVYHLTRRKTGYVAGFISLPSTVLFEACCNTIENGGGIFIYGRNNNFWWNILTY